jgi:hypothetical protein
VGAVLPTLPGALLPPPPPQAVSITKTNIFTEINFILTPFLIFRLLLILKKMFIPHEISQALSTVRVFITSINLNSRLLVAIVASILLHFFILFFSVTTTGKDTNSRTLNSDINANLIFSNNLLKENKLNDNAKETKTSSYEYEKETKLAPIDTNEKINGEGETNLSRHTSPTSNGGIFSRRMRKATYTRNQDHPPTTTAEQTEQVQSRNFILKLRHPSPDGENEVLCRLRPPVVACADDFNLPTGVSEEWFVWLQKGLAPEQLFVNKSLLHK